MNWDDLRIFLAVAREGSLSSAARKLGITQPTVGRRLKGLEESVGARLFDRIPDGYVPTSSGEELLPLAEAMEQTALTVERRQSGFQEQATGTVRVSVWEALAEFLLPNLQWLGNQLPDIEIEIYVTHIQANLIRREADLLIRECLPDNPDLITRKIGIYTYAVYGHRDYIATHPEALHEGRYQHCSWVGYDEDHAHFTNQAWLLRRLNGGVPSIRSNNGLFLSNAVSAGSGLGVLPCHRGDLDDCLQRLTPPISEAQRDVHLVVHKDLRRSPAVRAVMDVLIELFKKNQDILLGKSCCVTTGEV